MFSGVSWTTSIASKNCGVLDSTPAPSAAIVELLFTVTHKNYLKAMTPNNPSTLLFGPAVKNN